MNSNEDTRRARPLTARAPTFVAAVPGKGARPDTTALTFCLLLFCALLLRAGQFGNPMIDADEQFYLLVGQRMLDGALPYADIWDRKPPGLFLLYAGFAVFGDGVLAYQAGATLFAAATAWTVARMTASFASQAAGILAGLLYLCGLMVFSGDGGQTPVFYNLPMAGAAWAMLRCVAADDPGRLRRDGALAMVLVGIAAQIKYTAIFEGIFFGCALLWLDAARHRSLPRLAASAALWIAAACLPTLAALIAFAGAGHAAAFIDTNFLSIAGSVEPRPEVLLRRFGKLALLMSPFVAAGITGAAVLVRARDPRGWLLLGWPIAATLAIVAFGTYFEHYGLPIVLPAAIGAAPLFAACPRRRALGAFAIAFALVIGVLNFREGRHERGEPEDLAPFLAEIGKRPQGCLYVFYGPSALYTLSRSCLVSRIVFPSHLSTRRERDALDSSQDAELNRIFAAERPRFVVLPAVPPKLVDRELLGIARAWLARDYDLILRDNIGYRPYALYRRKGPAAGREAIRPG